MAIGPLVTVVVTVYNRCATVYRAVESVLKQTYANLECVVVDDGSTDGSPTELERFADARLRIVRHGQNRGVTAAKNTGLNNIRGEWFTFVDSDDEILPDAIETMMATAAERPDVTQVECNAIDASTGKLTGVGYENDGYLTAEDAATFARGDHWGIIKTSVLGTDRFNENLPGYEVTLWAKIMRRSKAYYIHRGLALVYTGGADRVSTSHWTRAKAANVFKHLLTEAEWLDTEHEFRPRNYAGLCLQGFLSTLAEADQESAKMYYNRLKAVNGHAAYRIVAHFARLVGWAGAALSLSLMNALKSARGLPH